MDTTQQRIDFVLTTSGTVGEAFMRIRQEALGLTQEELSNLMDFGRNSISDIENAKKIPNFETLMKLSNAVGDIGYWLDIARLNELRSTTMRGSDEQPDGASWFNVIWRQYGEWPPEVQYKFRRSIEAAAELAQLASMNTGRQRTTYGPPPGIDYRRTGRDSEQDER